MNDRGTVTIDSRTGRTLTYLGFVVRAERQRRRDIVADIKDDMTEGGWSVRLRKPQLQLRNQHSVSAPPNKSLDASGGQNAVTSDE
jgi:hypothetical protein